MNFVTILATMAAFWHQGWGQNQRRGKFLGMSSEDLWTDILEEVDDPLPLPTNTLSVREQVLKKIQKKHSETTPAVPLPPLPAQLIERLTTPAPVVAEMPKPERRRNVSQPEPMLVYDSATHKFELTPPGFASHPNPMTGHFVGQYGQYNERPTNMTVAELRGIWSFLGDIIEQIPFLPIQVNVPDLLTAMAAFFSERFPFINRFTDQTRPRPNGKLPDLTETTVSYYPEIPIDDNLLEYRQMEPPTERKNKNKKKKKKNRNKSKRKTTTETYRPVTKTLLRPTSKTFFSSATKAPKSHVTQKSWFTKPTLAPTARSSTTEDLKLFHHNNNPDSDQYKIKNMPITRHVTRYADRELFNFKHSDISNSPIMILNMPNRPVVMYKYKNDMQNHYPGSEG